MAFCFFSTIGFGLNPMMDWEALVFELREMISRQAAVIDEQNKRITQLEEEVRVLKNRKNSGNSSLPPSMDFGKPVAKPNQSLRGKSNLKSGGQPGHKGTTLEMSSNPDIIEQLLPQVCRGCHHSLEGQESVLIGRRQLVDIPPAKPIYTEYQLFERTCPCCNLAQSANYPSNVQAPIQYGPQVMSMVSYLYTRQFVPLKRLKELMNSLFGLSMSEGTIVNLLEKMVEKAMPAYQIIKHNILKSGYAGADETGCKVNGDNQWLWTLQNELYTYIWLSHTRGYDAIEEQFADELKNLILIHDCWSAYFQTGASAHQLCMAHLNRDLQYLSELYPDDHWVKNIRNQFSKALNLKREMVEDPPKIWTKARNSLEEKLKKYVEMPLENAGEKVIKFQKRLRKHLESLTTFLHQLHIPPDNNGSERAIRNVKVKLKVSGQFKTEKGADIFAVLRSVIDTLIKNDKDVFQALVTLSNC